ncbi:molybdenum cofactor biosynthesis protein MoaE [Fulvivirga sp. RKSG066]|uniref:molybdenum cofactor biosynthesis protein MoaE n=1 Tax=Fulvivirga aurantia TaxID=2529383 RepID=UPI0012BB9B8D|nr:molybdenum cofactor biosynthesis protein MoaE [Fulvivirga aurantia]MTI22320.1 molybdenum cofactor biosynthesis protein MoaE [Fulvivirga aurantia]
MIKITNEVLDRDAIISAVEVDSAGGICSFIGTVRNATNNKKVQRLEFEAYETMALKELQKIVDDIKQKWPVKMVVIHHRTGLVNIGEDAVVIAVSSAHRKEAFAACQYAIDTLKQTVPIWKKEVFEDGEEWVSAHP